jgi:hypothetical protein
VLDLVPTQADNAWADYTARRKFPGKPAHPSTLPSPSAIASKSFTRALT